MHIPFDSLILGNLHCSFQLLIPLTHHLLKARYIVTQISDVYILILFADRACDKIHCCIPKMIHENCINNLKNVTGSTKRGLIAFRNSQLW